MQVKTHTLESERKQIRIHEPEKRKYTSKNEINNCFVVRKVN